MLLAQPYGISSDDSAELKALEDEGFVVIVGHGWYGNGANSVEVWRAEQAARCGIDVD